MRARFFALFALFLTCVPVASAQLAAQVAYYDINGAWTVDGALFGTLTLNANANGTLRGTYSSPVTLNNNATCRGEHDRSGFVLLCQEANRAPLVITGGALRRTLTRVDGPPPVQMRGFIYMSALSPALATNQIVAASFMARRP